MQVDRASREHGRIPAEDVDPCAIAGYGAASRLDYVQIPFLFGLSTAGLGMLLYFAAQGSGRMLGPLLPAWSVSR